MAIANIICIFSPPKQTARRPTSIDVRLPNELVYKILVALLASSIHDICTLGPHAPLWDKHVVANMATTCYNWHQITKDILNKAFGTKLSGGERSAELSIFYETRIMLSSLNRIGTRSHHRPSPSALDVNSPIARTYSLYMTSVTLRRHAAQSQDLLIKTRPTLVAALKGSLKACDNVRPEGLVDTVRESINWELWAIDVDCSLAEARAYLESAADDIRQVGSHEHAETERHEIKTRMNIALSLAESVIPIPCGNCTIGRKFDQVQSSIKSSGILITLMKYSSGEIDFGLDEYDLKRRAGEYDLKGRADSLLEREKMLRGLSPSPLSH